MFGYAQRALDRWGQRSFVASNLDMDGEVRTVKRPLIVVTNDDGIDARGLWASVEALLPLGELLVAAPSRQWSGAGRAKIHDVTGRVTEATRVVCGQRIQALSMDLTPALIVDHVVLERAPRQPDLVVSGVNLGANLGHEVGLSGTVGAAVQAAYFGIPALAVSLAIDGLDSQSEDETADYSVAAPFAKRFAQLLLERRMPRDVDVLNLNVPAGASPDTPWRLTCVSRFHHYVPVPRPNPGVEGRMRHTLLDDYRHSERDSDIWATKVDHVVSVSALSIDMTSRIDVEILDSCLRTSACPGAIPVSCHVPALPNLP
jgi:5'-nucleotidase